MPEKLKSAASLVAEARRQAARRAKEAARRLSLFRAAELKAAIEAVPRRYRNDLSVWASSYTPAVFIELNVRNVDGFKCPEVLELLEPFSGTEWKADTTDGAEYGYRTYRFTRRVGEGGTYLNINCEFTVYPKADSSNCRAVVKGTKEEMVRRDIVEWVCD